VREKVMRRFKSALQLQRFFRSMTRWQTCFSTADTTGTPESNVWLVPRPCKPGKRSAASG
jgi:hypothetical protein